MMKKFTEMSLILALLLLVLTACSPLLGIKGNNPKPVNTSVLPTQAQATIHDAQVLSVEIQYGKTSESQMIAIVHGNLPDACSTLLSPQVSYETGTFLIKTTYSSPGDKGCAQIISPYEVTIPLDMSNLANGEYSVIANGFTTTFLYPVSVVQPPASLQLVVRASDGSLQIANIETSLNPTVRPTFNGFLPMGGSANGNAYILDADQNKVVVTDGKVFNDLAFVQAPAAYGLAVWPGDGQSQPRLAWATTNIGGDSSSTIKISALDGTQFDTLLTQEAKDPPSQLVVEFWSADGQWLYFSNEPVGLGGFILFSGGSNLYKINIATREIVDVIDKELLGTATSCLDSISPDFRYVAEHCVPTVIKVHDLTSGTEAQYIPPYVINTGFPLVGSARFSPDGTKLAYAIGNGDMEQEQGWVAISDVAVDNSRVILASQNSSYFSVIGWLDDQTILVQSTSVNDCSPACASELWTVGVDSSNSQKVADGSFLSVVPNDAFIQLPAELPSTPTATPCTDAAKYISDDGKDGITYAPNQAFTKTWTVKNAGSCSWDSSYLVYQSSGQLMTQQPGYWLVDQGQTVEPGQTVDISIGMTAPSENGTYRSYWVLKDADGQQIPVDGGVNNYSFYVDIKVSDGKNSGVVINSAIEIVQEQGSGDICSSGATYFVNASISVDGPTDVSYEIGSSAGQIPAGYFEDGNGLSPYVTGTYEFEQADTKTISLRFVGPYPYPKDITVMLRVNGGEWINTKLACP